MVSIRMLVVSTLAALAGSALFAAGCGGGGSYTSACNDYCDKQYSCGDIDSVKADQCRHTCDANADETEAELDGCINKDDILSAYNECLDRACSDYAKCLETLPSCKGGGTDSNNTGSGGPAPSGTACDQISDGLHVCYEFGGATQCPTGTTTVSACSTSNLLGTCTLTAGSSTDTVFYYAEGGFTVDQVQPPCEQSGGTWSSGGA